MHRTFHLLSTLLIVAVASPAFGGIGNTLSSTNVASVDVLASGDIVVSSANPGPAFLTVDNLDLALGESLWILQKSASDLFVLRVRGVCKVAGTVFSDGRLVLLGTHGVSLAQGSDVSAADLTVSALDFADNDILLPLPVPSLLPGIGGDATGGGSSTGGSPDGSPSTGLPTGGGSYTTGDPRSLSAEGRLSAFGGGSSRAPLPGHVRLFGEKLLVDANISAPGGAIVMLAGKQVQSRIDGSPAGLSEVLLPHSGSWNGPVFELFKVTDFLPPVLPASFQASASVSQAVGDDLEQNGLPVLLVTTPVYVQSEIIIDGGAWGPTRLDGALLRTFGPEPAGAHIGVYGGVIDFRLGTIESKNDNVIDTIRVGGDPDDLGVSREAFPAFAYRTFIGRNTAVKGENNDDIEVTGFSVMREGALPILLLSGHDGAVSPTWMADREQLFAELDSAYLLWYQADTDCHELLEGLVGELEDLTGEAPYTIEFMIDRAHVDVNRRSGRGTGATEVDEDDNVLLVPYGYGPDADNNLAYNSFHDAIIAQQQRIEAEFGAGTMFDLHGHDDHDDDDPASDSPLMIGYRIDLDTMFDGLGFDEEADYADALFRTTLNDNLNTVNRSSAWNLAESLAQPNFETDMHAVMFGNHSLYGNLRATTDPNGQPYKLYLIEGVNHEVNLRIGGYIMRRHGSSAESPDANVVPGSAGATHPGFVATVDGVQLEMPPQYRMGNANYLDGVREDLAAAIVDMLENLYGFNLTP